MRPQIALTLITIVFLASIVRGFMLLSGGDNPNAVTMFLIALSMAAVSTNPIAQLRTKNKK